MSINLCHVKDHPVSWYFKFNGGKILYLQKYMSKIQTYIIIIKTYLILVHQFLTLKWIKKYKTDIIYGKIPPNYNKRVRITNISSTSNSFTNLINHSYSFFFIYSLFF